MNFRTFGKEGAPVLMLLIDHPDKVAERLTRMQYE